MNFAFPATAANSASHGLEAGSRMKRSSITVSFVPISESGTDFHSHPAALPDAAGAAAGAQASEEAPDVDPQDASIATAASAAIAVVTFVTNFIFISPP